MYGCIKQLLLIFPLPQESDISIWHWMLVPRLNFLPEKCNPAGNLAGPAGQFNTLLTIISVKIGQNFIIHEIRTAIELAKMSENPSVRTDNTSSPAQPDKHPKSIYPLLYPPHLAPPKDKESHDLSEAKQP